ncbi:MAG: PSD1 domain-containing protein [Planctomycetaceae bacterium]|nr:PSD1 domain-containing protein [Planctomycetaceae bacterium]
MILVAQDSPTPLPDVVEYNRDIRPLLSDNCFFCHGPDKNKREADLRLDTQEGLHGNSDRGGALVPGQPAESAIFQRITSSDADLKMPPAQSGKSLSERDIQLLKKWIEQGGQYEGHWAFLPIRQEETTTETATDTSITDNRISDRIDDYIAQMLSEHNLQPSPEADRITLLRRLSFDLIGLPPSEQEVKTFIDDHSPQAYEKQVDRLLNSPHYGERLAMWWLDLVRYADTVGYHGDQMMSVSPFRDYVIESFNANKPFDQFTIEQLAGDLLPEPTREQQIASGYNRLGMMSAEGGVQDKEYLAKYIAERVRNTSGTWLGITLGCAECHDHKFDPLTTRDFYRFEAFFADIKERGLYSGSGAEGNWGPFIKVPNEQQAIELKNLDEQIAAVKMLLDTDTEELAAAQAEWEATQIQWTPLAADSMSSISGAKLNLRADGAILVSDKNADTDTYELTFSQIPPNVTAFRLEVLPDDSLPQKGPGRAGNGNFVLSEFKVSVVSPLAETTPISKESASLESAPNEAGTEQPATEDVAVTVTEIPVPLQHATATHEQTVAAEANPYGRWSIEAAIDGDAKGQTWGWAILDKSGQPHAAVFETVADLSLSDGAQLKITMAQNLDNPGHNIGCFRLAVATSPRPVTASAAPPAEIGSILALAVDQRNDTQRAELAKFYRTISPRLNPAREQLAALEKQRRDLDASIPSTLVTETVAPRMVRILPRGNWMDDSGEEVLPGFPEVLPTSVTSDQRLNRLDLAKWIVSPENPLTSRVVVNRLWKICFGTGISRKLDDLGAQGEWPSHPRLLDFLADDFRRHGWDVKRTIKAMVMSKTYRQSSLDSDQLREADPYNRWLARQSRFRLDAELVRDNALKISGLLTETIGGRSVFPYQPAGYWAYLNFPTREWKNDSGEKLYRRGLYTHWQRQYLHPGLMAFDAPSREECTADRARSNTPLQSLVLLNDPCYVEAARAFAEMILEQDGLTKQDRLDFAFRRAVSREATQDERAVLVQLLEAHLSEYEADPAAAAELLAVGTHAVSPKYSGSELAAWTSVARAMLNLHEAITRN